MNLQSRKRLTGLENELMVARQKDGGRDGYGVWDGHVYTNNQDLLQHRGHCPVSRGSLDGRGVWRRMDTCTCMAEALHCPPETITTLLIGYTPTENPK